MDDEAYTRHWSKRLLYTPGVRWMCEQGKAYWLVDVVASYQQRAYPKVIAEEFQVWRLEVHPDKSATVTMTEGNSDKPIITQTIEYTDYPEPTCEMYLVCTPGQPSVLMLTSEY